MKTLLRSYTVLCCGSFDPHMHQMVRWHASKAVVIILLGVFPTMGSRRGCHPFCWSIIVHKFLDLFLTWFLYVHVPVCSRSDLISFIGCTFLLSWISIYLCVQFLGGARHVVVSLCTHKVQNHSASAFAFKIGPNACKNWASLGKACRKATISHRAGQGLVTSWMHEKSLGQVENLEHRQQKAGCWRSPGTPLLYDHYWWHGSVGFMGLFPMTSVTCFSQWPLDSKIFRFQTNKQQALGLKEFEVTAKVTTDGSWFSVREVQSTSQKCRYSPCLVAWG